MSQNQRPELERLASTRGYMITHVFDEASSAAKARPGYEAMLKAARAARFDVLLIWSLDRFGRSMVGNLQGVLELDRVGVQVASVMEPWLDTGGPVRPLLVAIFSWVAEQERARLIERTCAGLDRGRPASRGRARDPSPGTPRPLIQNRLLAARALGCDFSRREILFLQIVPQVAMAAVPAPWRYHSNWEPVAASAALRFS